MSLSAVNNLDDFVCGNIEIQGETIEDIICLDQCEGYIKEVLDVFVEPKVVKQYIFRAPIIENGVLYKGYKLKLIMVATTNIEYTEASTLEQTKVLTRDKLFNVTMKLPQTYEEGKSVNIQPTVADISTKVLCKTKIYMSTYINITILV